MGQARSASGAAVAVMAVPHAPETARPLLLGARSRHRSPVGSGGLYRSDGLVRSTASTALLSLARDGGGRSDLSPDRR